MHPILPTLLKEIEEDQPEAFLCASEMLRTYNFGARSGVIEPYASLYAAHPFGDDDLTALKNALTAYLSLGQGTNLSSAVHGLSQIPGDDLVGILRTLLAQHLQTPKGQREVVGQLVVSLNNHGEQVNSGLSYSYDAVEKNVADAQRYLRKVGFP